MCNHIPIFLSHSYIPINEIATQGTTKNPTKRLAWIIMFNVEYPGDLSVILDAAKERFKWPVKVFINKFRKKSTLQIMLLIMRLIMLVFSWHSGNSNKSFVYLLFLPVQSSYIFKSLSKIASAVLTIDSIT